MFTGTMPLSMEGPDTSDQKNDAAPEAAPILVLRARISRRASIWPRFAGKVPLVPCFPDGFLPRLLLVALQLGSIPGVHGLVAGDWYSFFLQHRFRFRLGCCRWSRSLDLGGIADVHGLVARD